MSKTLLLADDSVVIQKLVGLSFANEDVEIISTDNGDDAMIKAREVVPDVVLADVVMPGKSGYEVCEALKQDPTLGHIPVLLLTGTFEAFDEARAESSGADGQITKPFEAQALVGRVMEVLATAAEAAAAAEASAAAPDEPPADESDLFDSDMTSLGSEDPLAVPDLSMPDLPIAELPPVMPETADSNAAVPRDALDTVEKSEPLPPPNGLQHTEDDFMLDEPGESRSALFGSPSDVMVDDLQAPAETPPPSPSPAPDRTELLDAPDTLDRAPDSAAPAALDRPPALDEPPALHRPPALPRPQALDGPQAPPSAEATRVVSEMPPLPGDPAAMDDPLDGLSDDFGLHDDSEPPIPPPAIEVDSVLASVSLTDDATILVADNDSNSLTTRSATALAQVPIESRPRGTNDDTRIDVNPDSDSQPVLPPAYDAGRAIADATVVSPPAPVADLDERLAKPAPDPSDLIDLGPTSLAADDLDFAFDVSEQQVPSDLDDPLERSYSALPSSSDASGLEHLSADPDPLAGEYDVSTSDIATAPPAPSSPSSESSEAARTRSELPPSYSRDAGAPLDETPADALISVDEPEDRPVATSEIPAEPETEDPSDDELLVGGVVVPADSAAQAVPDLSPMMEQQIQETLEKVAWEAFSDLSDSIVKQVMERVEQIAWEVIPQMAETLVREEIRRMKGDED